MGDPRKIRKKYETPSHPWIKSRIDEEKRLSKEFGTKNKKELWKTETVLKKFKSQAKKLISLTSVQAKIETESLVRRISELGLASGDVSFDTVLGLTLDDMMGRRLQSVVFKKGLAKSVKQARQFIVHEHVAIDSKVITSPSYLVTVKEEALIDFIATSTIFNEEHAERASPEILARKKVEAEDRAKQEAEAKAKEEAAAAKAAEPVAEAAPAEEVKVEAPEAEAKVEEAPVKEAAPKAEEKVEETPKDAEVSE